MDIENNYTRFGILLLIAALACSRGAPWRGDRDGRFAGEANPRVNTPAPGGAAASPATADVVVNVVAEDFLFSLDAVQASAGAVTFVVRNEGDMPHDFALSGAGVDEKTPMLNPGESATLEVTLGEGTYEYICTIPGHAMLGMKGTFTVVP